MSARRWTVVLPLKGGPGSKSRLGGPPGLATAIALDCLEEVLASAAVIRAVVVTSDARLGSAAAALGAQVVAERSPGAGLDAAVRDGLAVTDGAVAVLLADLPALRSADLDAALAAAARPSPAWVVVPDAEGTGSVLLAADRAALLRPRFGVGSAAAHVAQGATRLELDLPRLRRDVDTPADLAQALRLGCGRRTTTTLATVQATVHTYDVDHSSGSVVTDEGIVLPFSADVFAASALRHVRQGQRLTIETGGEGSATRVVSLRLESVGASPLSVRPERRQSRS